MKLAPAKAIAILKRLYEILDEHDRPSTGSEDATVRDLETFDALTAVLLEERKVRRACADLS